MQFNNIRRYGSRIANSVLSTVEHLAKKGVVKKVVSEFLDGPQAIHTANVKRRPFSHWHAGRKFKGIDLNAPRIGSDVRLQMGEAMKNLVVVGFFGKDGNVELNSESVLHYGCSATAMFYALQTQSTGGRPQINLVLAESLPETEDHGERYFHGAWDPLHSDYVKEKVLVMSLAEIESETIVWNPDTRKMLNTA